MSEEHATTEQLIQRSRAGDRDAISLLLLEHSPMLQAFIKSRLGDQLAGRVGADDILQETFISAMKGVAKLEKDDEATFVSWLRTIASNRIKDTARKHGSKKRGGDRKRVGTKPNPFKSSAINLLEELARDSKSPSRIVAGDEGVQALQVAMSRLTEDQYRALKLHEFDGLTLEETAEQMGRTTGSVRGLLQRARENLRGEMGTESKWLSKG
ncbi:MAG: sigma-70 family RNA polymerase sigma factor [Planctomycetota bacterium]